MTKLSPKKCCRKKIDLALNLSGFSSVKSQIGIILNFTLAKAGGLQDKHHGKFGPLF